MAHDIFLKSAATATDPWLIAAELSVANRADRNPKFFREGCHIVIEGGREPRQITELAGAIGTLELESGKRKKARNLFRQSIIDPTGSALAQAEWASTESGLELISPQRLDATAEAEEARVFHYCREEKYKLVPDECAEWAKTEPYSIRPYEIGSSTAATIGDYQRSLDLARSGLLIRPDAATLLDNEAFALANLGQLDEAENSLKKIRHDNEIQRLISKANSGLLAMRKGDHFSGLEHYTEAIAGFRRENAPNWQMLPESMLPVRPHSLKHLKRKSY